MKLLVRMTNRNATTVLYGSYSLSFIVVMIAWDSSVIGYRLSVVPGTWYHTRSKRMNMAGVLFTALLVVV